MRKYIVVIIGKTVYFGIDNETTKERADKLINTLSKQTSINSFLVRAKNKNEIAKIVKNCGYRFETLQQFKRQDAIERIKI